MSSKRNVIRHTNKTRNISNLNDVDEFICAECGIKLKDWSRIVTDEEAEDEYCYEYAFEYCPNCGRKVVEE